MEEILQWISEHTFVEVLVVFAVMLLTQLLKWPIKAAAEKHEQRTGINKSSITWVISFIPLILCFAYSFCANGIQCHWDMTQMSWMVIIQRTVILSSTSIGFYEAGKKVVEAMISKKVAQKTGELKDGSEFIKIEEVKK